MSKAGYSRKSADHFSNMLILDSFQEQRHDAFIMSISMHSDLTRYEIN